jgi:perosamine synthetase
VASVGTYSFQATKTITTGEGGMVVTNDESMQRRMALYRSHGMLGRRYLHEVPGHNFRLTNLQAALGCAQLQRLESIVSDRHRVHATYRQHLGRIDGVTLQLFRPEVEPVLWAIAGILDAGAFPQGRDRVMEELAERGIETRNAFIAASEMSIYGETGALPVSEHLSRNAISLPTYPTLEDEQIGFICDALSSLRR